MADALSSDLRLCGFESRRRHRIGSSVGIESAGLRSLRTRVRVSPDALADVAQPGRRAAPRTLLLEVQILSSALIAGMAQRGRRGGLKNRILWVRIPLPALNFVGVAQMGERERAMLESGSSNLLAHFKVAI
jgi:hypothetical protein